MSRHRLIATTTTVVPPPRDSVQHLARWAAAACPRGARVLSVGAGGDVSGSLGPLLRRSPHLVGVDPDRAVRSNRSLTEWHQTTLEEFAAGTSDRFDLEHHFPTVYRCNSVRAIRRHCSSAGFSTLDFRCYDATDRYQWYLPDRLSWFPPAYTRAAYALGRPQLMGHLSFRAQMPA